MTFGSSIFTLVNDRHPAVPRELGTVTTGQTEGKSEEENINPAVFGIH